MRTYQHRDGTTVWGTYTADSVTVNGTFVQLFRQPTTNDPAVLVAYINLAPGECVCQQDNDAAKA